MELNNSSIYLNERKYISKKVKNFTGDINKVYTYWKTILGEELLDYICEKYNLNVKELFTLESFQKKEIDNMEIRNIHNIIDIFKEGNYESIKLPKAYNSKNTVIFYSYNTRFIKLGVYCLLQKLKSIPESMIISFIQTLYTQFFNTSTRTLVFEMYICKSDKSLIGNTQEDEYDYYDKHFLNNLDYIEDLFSVYPCLERVMFEAINRTVNNYVKFWTRLMDDHELIVNLLCDGHDFKTILEMSSSMSDSHQNGKMVYTILLDNNVNVVYKPHSLKCEAAYQSFASFLSKKCDTDMKAYTIIDKDDYGWVEYIDFSTCEDIKQLKKYYYRFGIISFIHYLLHTNDLHYENIIASGEYPIIIDAETILDNSIKEKQATAVDGVYEVLRNSVMHSGLFPFFMWQDADKAIDLSAINGHEGQKFPIKVAKLVDLKTSNMHFDYDYPTIDKEKNLATCNNEFINSEHFVEDIVDGFSKAYTYAFNHKDEIINNISVFENIRVRHIIQDTQRYCMLLHTSYHPNFMHDGRDRELFLSTIYNKVDQKDDKLSAVKVAEIKDLLNNDVPYFYCNTSKKDLYSSRGYKIENYFDESSIYYLKKKINLLNDVDFNLQKQFIRKSLAGQEESKRDINIEHLPIIGGIQKHNFNKDMYIKAAKIIGEYLKESAIYNFDRTEVNWVGTSFNSNLGFHFDFAPLSNSLYDGISGVAIYFHALMKLSGSDQYIELCNALSNTLFHYTDSNITSLINGDEKALTGGFNGESSIVYAYLAIYKITGKKVYLSYAIKHIQIIEELITKDVMFDFVSGNAGAISVILDLYDLSKDSKYLNLARIAGNVLINNQIKQPVGVGWKGEEVTNPIAGLSHGVSGIAMSLFRLWKYTGEETYLQAVINGLNYENSLYDSLENNWKDMRVFSGVVDDDMGIRPVAWCHGASGVLLSRLEMFNGAPKKLKEILVDDIKKASKKTLEAGIGLNQCLCHGTLGNAYILLKYCDLFDDKECQSAVMSLIQNTVYQIIDGNWANEQYNFKRGAGFMLGGAGMGYMLLQMYEKNLPSVLTLNL